MCARVYLITGLDTKRAESERVSADTPIGVDNEHTNVLSVEEWRKLSLRRKIRGKNLCIKCHDFPWQFACLWFRERERERERENMGGKGGGGRFIQTS